MSFIMFLLNVPQNKTNLSLKYKAKSKELKFWIVSGIFRGKNIFKIDVSTSFTALLQVV